MIFKLLYKCLPMVHLLHQLHQNWVLFASLQMSTTNSLLNWLLTGRDTNYGVKIFSKMCRCTLFMVIFLENLYQPGMMMRDGIWLVHTLSLGFIAHAIPVNLKSYLVMIALLKIFGTNWMNFFRRIKCTECYNYKIKSGTRKMDQVLSPIFVTHSRILLMTSKMSTPPSLKSS